MTQITEKEKRIIEMGAEQYLSLDPDTDDIYSAYKKLVDLEANGKGDDVAADYVEVWKPFEHKLVGDLLDDIQDTIAVTKRKIRELGSNPIEQIDWWEFANQRDLLIELKDSVNSVQAETLEGILNLFDSIQDYAIDVLDFTEEEVLNKNLVGYQVVSKEDTEFHPDMESTFTIYSYSQANEIIKNSDNPSLWECTPRYEDEIENPEFAYEGDPKN